MNLQKIESRTVASLTFGCIVTTFLAFAPAHAEIQLPKASPKALVSQQIGVSHVTVSYSSPAVKGRSIWGGLVPHDQVWRTGANECTKFTSTTEIEVGGKTLAAGDYCLGTIPRIDRWTVILSKDSALWGSFNYDPKNDAARFDVEPLNTPMRERLLFEFDEVSDSSAVLRLRWEKVALEIPLTVKTKELSLKNIAALSSSNWRDYADAARYVLEEAKNSTEATKLIDKSLSLDKTWFNHWIKSQTLEAQGNHKEALRFAREAIRLGDTSNFFRAYEGRIKSSIDKLQRLD